MRICVVTRELAGISSYYGGIGTTYAQLGPALARLGHEVHVLTLAPREHIGKSELEGVRLHLLQGDSARPSLRLPLLFNRQLSRLGKFDVIFTCEWGGDSSLYSRRGSNGPLVTNLATSLLQATALSPHVPSSHGRQLVRDIVQRRLERFQTEHSDAIVPVSNAIWRWTSQLWNVAEIPCQVLPNGIDLTAARRFAELEPPDGFPETGPRVAFVGRLEERKGVDVLARAMKAVWRRYPEARLVLIGGDTGSREQPMSERISALGGSGARVDMLGPQPVERAIAGMARAEIVALPSLWEAFGNVAVESMAVGKPTVYTSGSGFDDIFEDGVTGMAVPPGDPGPLAERICTLLGDPGLAGRIGASAYERAEEFGVDPIARRFAKFFAEVAARGP